MATSKRKKPAAKKPAKKKPAAKKPIAARVAKAKPSKVAPKAKPAPKAKALVPLTVEALLARSAQIAQQVTEPWDAVCFEAAARRCVAAKRADLAAALAAMLPENCRCGVLAIAASGGAGSADDAIDAILKTAAEAPRSRPHVAAIAYEASKLLSSPRTAELVAFVDDVIDEALGEEPVWGAYKRFDALLPLFALQIAHGEARSVRRLLERGIAVDAESTGEVLEHGLLWKLSTEPQHVFPLINAIDDSDRYTALRADDGLRACVGWSRDDLDALVAFANVRSELAKELVDVGRIEDARHVLFELPEEEKNEWREPTYLAEDYLLVADEAGAKRALEGQSHEPGRLALLKIKLGIDSIASGVKKFGKPEKDGSVMSNVRSLMDLAKLAVEGGEPTGDIDGAIDKLLASPKRSQYDRGVEGSTRQLLADERMRLAAKRDPSATRALIEADVDGIAALLAHGKDSWSRNSLTEGVARRALEHGFPDLAIRASKKLRFDPGNSHFPHALATALLPADPAAALDAFDTIVKEPDKGLALQRWEKAPLFAQLWAAVAGGAA